jgi:parallel beta-helix repeat protein
LASLSFSAEIKAGNSFEAIQKALNKAKSGDTIYIRPGIYKSTRPLEISGKKNITITSKGIAKLINTDTISHVITIDASSHVTLKNIHATHIPAAEGCAGDVILITRSKNIKISNCDINGCGVVGIEALNSKNVTVTNNVIHNNSYVGICLIWSNNAVIKNNRIINNKRRRVEFHNSKSITLEANVFRNNKNENIFIRKSTFLKLRGNTPGDTNYQR